MTGSARVIRANARDLPLADNSVDLVVTSPPYFALRSYQDGGEHYAGQIGDEPTPAAFVDSLLEVTTECVRVLKPSGSLWVNLGDKYAQSAGQWQGSRRGQGGVLKGTKQERANQFGQSTWDDAPQMGRPKSLIGIPWRYALRCIDELGLILRAEVIWSKPNGLPESVTDRVRRSHEQWFHFTLSPRYFSAVDEIREASNPANAAHSARYNEAAKTYGKTNNDRGDKGAGLFIHNPLGKLPGSVWTVPTEPLNVPDHLGVDHFAAFPTEWPRRIIAGWSPAGVCVECGEGRRPVSHRKPMEWRPGPKAGGYEIEGTTRKVVSGTMLAAAETTITGYTCSCEGDSSCTTAKSETTESATYAVHPTDLPPTRPAVVLDPFGGTGTTALVAKVLGRHGISVDMSADYCRLAEWRTTDPDQLAKAARVEKPPKQIEGQISLFDTEEATA